MSLTVKKIPFGNEFQITQRNFGIPVLQSPAQPPVQQPLQQPAPLPAAEYQTLPVQNQPIQTQNLPTIPSMVPPQTNISYPAAPLVYPSINNDQTAAKTLGFVSAGLALLSLGITGVNVVKNKNTKNITEAIEKSEQKIMSMIDDQLTPIIQRIDNVSDSLGNKIEKETNDRIGLGKWLDGVIDDVRKIANTAREIAENKASQIIESVNSNFLSRKVQVNGVEMNLATTLNGYGKNTELLQQKLRTESAKRMFGLIDRSSMEVPETVTIRVPTSEFKGIASTGGMSIVPKEVMANLGAFINNKQKTRLIVDMPMYLGEVENNSASGKQTFYALNALSNGKFAIVSKPIYKGNKESVILGNLEKLADIQIPIYDDLQRSMQNVEVYMARGLKQKVDYNLLRQYLTANDLAVYNDSINKYVNQEAPKIKETLTPLRNKLAEAQRKEAELIKSSELQNIREEIKSVENKIGNLEQEFLKANSVENKIKLEEDHLGALTQREQLQKQFAEMSLELEKTNPEFKAVRDEIRNTSDEIANITKKFKQEHGTIYKNGLLSVSGDVDGHITAEVEFDGVFYKNEKFDMKGPRFDGAEGNKNIYNNKTINSGEPERFAYFNKYFYEFLTKSHEVTSEKLGADLIIGNDWQTGGISAMTRLLTLAKAAVGDLTPAAAEKLYNTPIVTILHNAKEAGRSAHSNSKLFNVLFGEHSAMITENAYMPDISRYHIPEEYRLPDKCLNGLMHSNCVDPQTMATSYSDVIVPVSDKYYEEIATQGVYGRENFELFRLRKFASDNPEQFKGQKTIIGITNGSDRINNILTEENARKLEAVLKLPKNSLQHYDGEADVLQWHNHNKKVILDRVIADINDPQNPMKIELPEITDLTGVNENTMIVATAGRIVDQKGLDIFAESIEEFLRSHKITDGNYPVFYAQGTGDRSFIEKILAVKKKVASDPELGGEEAAKRIVFANLFSEPGRYDACQLMSDFSIMSSWFEPCGLVHKEIAAKSGAIPIVNETGGLTSGLTDGLDAIFSKFKPENPDKASVIGENKTNFANAMWRAYEIFTNDKAKFGDMLTKSYKNDFSWLVADGPMAQYVKMLIELKVLKPDIMPKAA